MDFQEEMIALLRQIREEVSLLTVQVKAEAVDRFDREFLTTPQRRRAYEAFDGCTGVNEIAEIAGCGARAIQMFIKELEEKDLIDVVRDGNAKVPARAITKIALYYARQGGIPHEQ
ncbi:MAG: hypothetical protein ACM3X4_08215 [Ignavibacteriales bacterium]